MYYITKFDLFFKKQIVIDVLLLSIIFQNCYRSSIQYTKISMRTRLLVPVRMCYQSWCLARSYTTRLNNRLVTVHKLPYS
jgi:hypothetical protein